MSVVPFMKMQILVVSDCDIVEAGICLSIESAIIEVHRCLYFKPLDLRNVQSPYQEGFDAVIISLKDLKQASDVSTEANSMWFGVKLIIVKNSDWNDKESENILSRVSWRITRAEKSILDLKDSISIIHNILFFSIKRDKCSPQIDSLSNAELEVIYYLQKPISDIKELSKKINKSRSQINNLLSSIAIKMNVPNNRAGLVVSTFRGLGEVRKTSGGAFALPSIFRY
jgi:hypothetical protein